MASKTTRLVGTYIREKREALRLSQRALGSLFSPPVTTQFISNIERGVTPLPPVHVPVLARALTVPEQEIMSYLEREYTAKLSGRLGKAQEPTEGGTAHDGAQVHVASEDCEFFRTLYEFYRRADISARQTFTSMCESTLGLPKRSTHG